MSFYLSFISINPISLFIYNSLSKVAAVSVNILNRRSYAADTVVFNYI